MGDSPDALYLKLVEYDIMIHGIKRIIKLEKNS